MRFLITVHPARLAKAPSLRVSEETAGRALLRVDGLVCGLCAARTERALGGTPGVEAARVNLVAGTAELWLAPAGRVDEAALRRALDSVVLGARVRRWLERSLHHVRAAYHGPAVRALVMRASDLWRAVRAPNLARTVRALNTVRS